MSVLFYASLLPFMIGWMDQSEFALMPTAVYGVLLALAAIAYLILERTLIVANGGERSRLAAAVGDGLDWKTLASLATYVVAIALAFVRPCIAIALCCAISAAWFVPDPRMEKTLQSS